MASRASTCSRNQSVHGSGAVGSKRGRHVHATEGRSVIWPVAASARSSAGKANSENGSAARRRGDRRPAARGTSSISLSTSSPNSCSSSTRSQTCPLATMDASRHAAVSVSRRAIHAANWSQPREHRRAQRRGRGGARRAGSTCRYEPAARQGRSRPSPLSRRALDDARLLEAAQVIAHRARAEAGDLGAFGRGQFPAGVQLLDDGQPGRMRQRPDRLGVGELDRLVGGGLVLTDSSTTLKSTLTSRL